VAKVDQVPVSQMPPGLINTLNPEELADLVAYLMSGGDANNKAFKE
jgi:mono/diheme cytochrome c family protein